ncbi:MAG: Gldg family protein [Desulfatitalea sp.]|nr:Gldg family protein [Desulfatitalea sp.]
MNAKAQPYAKYIKFAVYALIVVLVNLAGLTLFFRADLTRNKVYSLSPVSKTMAATLTEPLTIKVFFTKDLPAPHNTTELYLRDLLNEYALQNKQKFKVRFYNVSAETEGLNDAARDNQQMAREYGIQPVQIQIVEKDELKFKQAYMGLVLIHGDIIERVPTITSTDGLEYKLTTAIQKLNHKVSALLALDQKVRVTVVLSSSFYKVAPMLGLKELDQFPDRIKAVVEGMKAKTYDRLEYQYIDPTEAPDKIQTLGDLEAMSYTWPDIPKANIASGEGIIGMLMRYKNQVRQIPLLRVVRIPIFGDQYQLTPIEQIEDLVSTNLDRLININEEIGYLSGFGTLSMGEGGNPMGPQDEGLNRFGELLNQNYALKAINLNETPVPEGLKCLIVARPTEPLSDYALYQIDQALMRGTNLALFVDALQEQQQNQGLMMGNQQMRFHVPLKTGLEKMLAHYGVRIKESFVMDENCYREQKPAQQGGGDQPIYFIPRIENAHINKELDYLENIKGMYAFLVSPLELDDKRIGEQKITAHMLFSSSERSWEMRDRIILNPIFIQPPASDSEMASRPLAYLLDGTFGSYFKGKPMPEKPAEQKPEEPMPAAEGEKSPATPTPAPTAAPEPAPLKGQSPVIEQGAPAKIFVIASAKMIGDQLMDEQGQGPNTVFVLNMLDALNGREAVAAMRGKAQRLNPLQPIGGGTKALIKAANIAGLPMVVVFFGLLVWWRRHARTKKIQALFQ